MISYTNKKLNIHPTTKLYMPRVQKYTSNPLISYTWHEYRNTRDMCTEIHIAHAQ